MTDPELGILTEMGTHPIAGRANGRPFVGTATLYRYNYEGTHKSRQKVQYVALCHLTTDNPTELWCGGSGYVGAAVKKAFHIRNRLGCAAHEYLEYPDPIGTPTHGGHEGRWAKGVGALTYTA